LRQQPGTLKQTFLSPQYKCFLNKILKLCKTKNIIIMNKYIFFIIIPALMLVMSSFSGCSNHNPELKETVCDVENPLTDLKWLSQLIAVWEENSQNGFGVPCKIYQSIYDNEKICFIIEYCSGCPDAMYSVSACDGTTICGGGGIAGEDTCEELTIDFANQKLIYSLN
jgi:hypothetical protein